MCIRDRAVYTIRVGAAKCALPFGSALGLGVLCNLLVCLGVLAAASARETPGRLMGAFLPVCFFVLCGFEHSVANLYYIGAALMAAAVPQYASLAAAAGVDLAPLTPVSYTHLDVYKRQSMTRPSARRPA